MWKRAIRLTRRHGLTALLLSFVTACVVFGGAGREGHFGHGALQALACLGLAGLIASWPSRVKLEEARAPLLILSAIVVIGLIQMLPLPPGFWHAIPGRDIVAEGYSSLDIFDAWLPVSLDVEATLMTLGYVAIPFFVLLLSVRIGLRRLKDVLPWFLSLLGVATVIYGLFQVFDGRDSLLYLYDFTSNGLPVGFFSNVNHQASLLLMILPFTLFLLSELGQDWNAGDRGVALAIIIVALAFMLLIGIFGAGSVGGYAILAPILLMSFLASQKPKRGLGQSSRIGILAAFAFGALLVGSSPVLEGIGVTSFSDGEGSRYSIWQITMTAIGDHWITGSGLGTYESVIPIYENPETVTATFVAMAHNDYLQVIMEGGLLGGALLLFALYWYGSSFFKIWGKSRGGSKVALRKFASVAVLAILLHSIVDYPARTPAIAAVFGLCIALMVLPESRGASRSGAKSEESGSKRVVI
ncbi:MAG: O-antigen ligase family protein [Pseudomonadota bacterium]